MVHDPDSVFDGMRRKNGWQTSGLPWTYALDPATKALPAREVTDLQHGNDADCRDGPGGRQGPPPAAHFAHAPQEDRS